MLLRARDERRTVFVLGNGGSAATASHLACDLGKGTATEGAARFRVLSLCDNSSLLTALGNDHSFEQIFVEQLKGLLGDRDVVIVISASGNSPNVLRALEYARSRGAQTIGLLGFGGGEAAKMVDVALVSATRNYGIAEDLHLVLQHMLTQAIRKSASKRKVRVLFLDRDGVINVKPPEHDYVREWEAFRFYPGAPEALRTLSGMGYRLIVTTNQRGIARGLLTERALQEIHANMLDSLATHGVEMDAVYYCPHDEHHRCQCRKPAPGMFYRAQAEMPYAIDFENSIVVGDSASDVAAGESIGAKTALILNGSDGPSSQVTPTFVAKDLLELASVIAAVEPQTRQQPE
jgi:D-sedoheptulose 7-phosphate isomerase